MSDSCCAKRALHEAQHRIDERGVDEREALNAHLFGIAFSAIVIVSLAMALTALMRWFVDA